MSSFYFILGLYLKNSISNFSFKEGRNQLSIVCSLKHKMTIFFTTTMTYFRENLPTSWSWPLTTSSPKKMRLKNPTLLIQPLLYRSGHAWSCTWSSYAKNALYHLGIKVILLHCWTDIKQTAKETGIQMEKPNPNLFIRLRATNIRTHTTDRHGRQTCYIPLLASGVKIYKVYVNLYVAVT